MQFIERLYSWASQKKGGVDDSIHSLTQHRIMRLADDVNYLFMEMDKELIDEKPKLAFPQIVTAGTQSSGKSTVLNRIMNLDLLPTGSEMETRTPLYIRMHHHIHPVEKEVYVEMKEYTDTGETVTLMTVEFNYPRPLKGEIEAVRNYIRRKTNEYAGDGMNISAQPIIIDLYSPDVPNLSLVDLPGLMMIAQPDKGQPADIKEQIEAIVSKYITRPNVIILGIIQARQDLETDQGLAFIKRCAEHPDRKVVGVLTKPDLMNDGTDVSNYLSGKVSQSLQLSEGYYLVKNSIDPEHDPFENTKVENDYFASHSVYSRKSFENRVGINPLKTHLSQLLLSSICRSLPLVLSEIMRLDKLVERQLQELGEPIPDTEEAKLSYLHNFINSFSRSLTSLLEDRGLTVSAGKSIKEVFIKFRRQTQQFNPFESIEEYPNNYFQTLIENFEGNHMSFSVPHVEVLECCMMDTEKRPVQMLTRLSQQCIDQIHEVLVHTVQLVIRDPRFKRYLPLCQAVEETLVSKLLSMQREKAVMKVLDYLETEESYIWSDDPSFKKVLQEVTKTPVPMDGDFSHVRTLVSAYYQTIKYIFSDRVPKIVMNMLVRELEKTSHRMLFDELVAKKRTDLLKDDSDTEKRRLYYEDLNGKIQRIKASMEEGV